MLEKLETDAEEQRKQQLDATDVAWKHTSHWLSLVLNMFLSFGGDVFMIFIFFLILVKYFTYSLTPLVNTNGHIWRVFCVFVCVSILAVFIIVVM